MRLECILLESSHLLAVKCLAKLPFDFPQLAGYGRETHMFPDSPQSPSQVWKIPLLSVSSQSQGRLQGQQFQAFIIEMIDHCGAFCSALGQTTESGLGSGRIRIMTRAGFKVLLLDVPAQAQAVCGIRIQVTLQVPHPPLYRNKVCLQFGNP